MAKILLVDDREENLIALEEVLHSQGLGLLKARSGMDALALLLDHDVALALVDVQMPEMSGFELAELMRGAERTKHIPIVFVTAGTRSQQNTFKGYESGAVDFLYKPLDPFIVRSKVAVFVELYRQKVDLRAQLVALERTLERLRMTESELQRAVASRDEFLTVASHELRTPLTPLKLQVQMLIDQASTAKGVVEAERVKVTAEKCHTHVNRVVGLVETILDVSQISRGALVLHPEELDLSALVQGVADRYREPLEAVGCELTVNIQPDIRARCDRIRTEQAVGSLLQNVLKYATKAPVSLRLRRAGEDARIEVRDAGPGIARADQDRIFVRFERAMDSRHISGLGLGLYIARQIVDAQRGRISVDSEPGRGATFIIDLPRLPEAAVGATE